MTCKERAGHVVWCGTMSPFWSGVREQAIGILNEGVVGRLDTA